LGLSIAAHESLSSFGDESERKSKLFVAMPFADKHSDVWDIAIRESCQAAGLLCERLDEEAYTGDILKQITSRLRKTSGVLAVLDDANPNVFLEIGFAWGTGKPTVLIAKKDTLLPFDVRGQKTIHYTSIANLRSLLKAELTSLKAQGVFNSSG
jgi:nucleoside 2-deoxyribosyltransferase